MRSKIMKWIVAALAGVCGKCLFCAIHCGTSAGDRPCRPAGGAWRLRVPAPKAAQR